MSLLLRILLTRRKLTAHVTNKSTNSIIAMATTYEPEFNVQYRAKVSQTPRVHDFIDPKIAAQIGERLGLRLKDIGVGEVEIDVAEERSRNCVQRRVVKPIFASVQDAGVRVLGVEKLGNLD